MKPTFFFYFIVSILFLSTPIVLHAQKNGVIKGKVIDNAGNAAIAVSVELKGQKKLTYTANDGFFSLHRLPSLTDTLIISSAETKIYKQLISLKKDEVIDLGVIQLHDNVPQLQNVEIAGRMARSYKSDYSFFVNKTETPLINIPQSVSTVTKELIMDKMALNLKDVVDGVAGVNQYSGYDEYTIRGFRAENSRDINGLRGYNTTYTNSMLVNIERVEIIKGPSSTLYGNGDPGGTINLVTKKPLKDKETELNMYGGSWDHYRILADNTGPLNKKQTWLYRINAGYDNNKSFRSIQNAESYQVAPSLSFIPNNRLSVNFDFSVSHINSVLDRGQPGILDNTDLLATPIKLSVSQPGDFLHETDIASIASVSYKINDRLSFNTGLLNYITQQNVANHGLESYITPDSVNLFFTKWKYHTVTYTNSNYFTYNFNTSRLNHKLVVGYDYISSKVNLNQGNFELPDEFGEESGIVGTFSLIRPVYLKRPVNTYQLSGFDSDETEVDKNVYHTQGIYVQDEISLNRWKLLVGLREEFYKGEGEEEDDKIDQKVFLPRVGIVYAFRNNLSAFVTYNKGFDPFEASGEMQIFDETIKPQISESFEGGIKGNFFSNKFFSTVSFYQITVQNVAVNANDISNPDLYVQQGLVRSRGAEAETEGSIGNNLSISFAYAYNDAKIAKSKTPGDVGKRLENAPVHSGSSWIKYDFKENFLKGFKVSLGHSFASKRETLDPEMVLPGYFILNAGMQYRYKNFSVALNAENLTDRKYWTGAYNNVSKWPGKPVNFMCNVRVTF